MKEALFYKKLDKGLVECSLCYHHCKIIPGKFGYCNARVNVDGVLISNVYGKIIALNVDPIEKKPLYHFYPGSKAYSIGTCGCNFHCKFCQNYEISQAKSDESRGMMAMTPDDVVSNALALNCLSIAYTYNEPTVNYEFALETSKLAEKSGLKNIFVTNGYIEKKPLKLISKHLDAAVIDLKGFNNKMYKEFSGADLTNILKTIKEYHKLKVYIELTMLLIPGRSDDLAEIRAFSKWVVKNLSTDTPVHFLRYFPYYKMGANATPESTISKAVEIAKAEGLLYVYGGNIFKKEFINTVCSNCGNLLIDRINEPRIIGVKNGACKNCKKTLFLHY